MALDKFPLRRFDGRVRLYLFHLLFYFQDEDVGGLPDHVLLWVRDARRAFAFARVQCSVSLRVVHLTSALGTLTRCGCSFTTLLCGIGDRRGPLDVE